MGKAYTKRNVLGVRLVRGCVGLKSDGNADLSGDSRRLKEHAAQSGCPPVTLNSENKSVPFFSRFFRRRGRGGKGLPLYVTRTCRSASPCRPGCPMGIRAETAPRSGARCFCRARCEPRTTPNPLANPFDPGSQAPPAASTAAPRTGGDVRQRNTGARQAAGKQDLTLLPDLGRQPVADTGARNSSSRHTPAAATGCCPTTMPPMP
jgi:hypothetical protein